MKSKCIFHLFHDIGQTKEGIRQSVFKNRFFLKDKYSYPRYVHKDIISPKKDPFSSVAEIYTQIKKSHDIKNKKQLYFLGGDHSISIATLAHSLRRVQNPKCLKVIWIDAHADANTYINSPTKNLHGMPLAYAMLFDKHKKFDFFHHYMRVLPENLLYIGIRDLDPAEKEIIERHDISVITCKEVNEDPVKVKNKLSNFIDGNPVHLSFDVDALDPQDFPCTGTPVKNGIYLKPMLDLLSCQELQENKIATDIVESNYDLGSIQNQLESKESFLKILNRII